MDTTNKTKAVIPSLPFLEMKNAILGTDYELSLVFVGTQTIHKLNRQYREKDAPTDILSFPLSDTSGEICINPTYTQKKSVEFEKIYTNYLGFLFIHGLLHLKGMEHGSTMEKEEIKFCKKFGF